MNFLKKFMRTSAIDEVALIPSGKLFLARSPSLPKGALECLYNDAYITIKQTTTPYFYQLAVIRAYEEGEVNSQSNDEADEDDSEESAADLNADERMFFLTPELRVRITTRDNGTRVIRWKDMSGDVGDRFEFVVDEEIRYSDVDYFMVSMYRCLYELKYQKSAAGVETDALNEFVYDDDEEEEQLPGVRGLIQYQYGEREREERERKDREYEEEFLRNQEILKTSKEEEDVFSDALDVPMYLFSPSLTIKYELLFSAPCELRVFDPDTNIFRLVAPITAQVIKAHEYYVASTTPNYAFAIPVSQGMHPVFYLEHKVFIFNYLTSDSVAYSLMLKFSSVESLDQFQQVFYLALSAAVDHANL